MYVCMYVRMYVQVQDVGKKLKRHTGPSIRHEVEVQLQLLFPSELEGMSGQAYQEGRARATHRQQQHI